MDRDGGPRATLMPAATRTTSGLTILGAAAGAGKSGISVGLGRILAGRGVPTAAFKPVGVVNLADVTCPEGTLWKRAAFYNCYSTDSDVCWWNSPVVVVPEPSGREGRLHIAGQAVADVPIAGEDTIDFVRLGAFLRTQAQEAIMAAVKECRERAEFVLQEGSGCAGAIDPEGDLANVFAVKATGSPAVLVAKSSKVEHMPSLVGAYFLIAKEIPIIRGFILNQTQPQPAAQAAERISQATGMAYLGSIGTISFPVGFDGSLAQQRALDNTWAAGMQATGVAGRLLDQRQQR